MRRGTRWPTTVGFLVVLTSLPFAAPAAAVSPDVVISQVYGGGGNSGATYTHDFIELFNRGTTSVALGGWSIQYASATGTGSFGANSGQQVDLPNVSLAPGQYFLIQEASTAAVGSPLPTPDMIDATPINMSGTAGKVALATGTESLGCNGGSTPCSAAALARIVDLVGYGAANFFEGAGPAPTLSNTTAGFRASGGCIDTDNNTSDFAAVTPAARNTASPINNCNDAAPSVSATSPLDDAIGVTVGSNLTITFSEAVSTSGTWYAISCGTSGPHTAVASGGPTTFTLNPDSDFAELETCTVTVLAANVTDQNANDPPNNMAADYVFDFQTEGDVCNQSFTPIPAIQGSGPSAAITGNVTTEGVVVGDFEGSTAVGFEGFYMQDVAGDGDATSSDGIFVYTGSNDNSLSVGDVVRVTGFARERFSETALNGTNSNTSPVTSLVVCGTAALPAPVTVTLPMANATAFEQYEGMRVNFPQSLVIAEYFNYDRFGEIVLAQPLAGETRPFTGTAIDEPGAAANARNAANLLSRVTLDDGLGASNPPSVRHPNGAAFTLSNFFRGGDTVANTVGVLGFAFSRYRIQPTGPADYTAVNARPASPDDTDGRITVAAQNMLNFFLTLDTTASDSGSGPCGGGSNLDCRGADSSQPLEFDRQRDKLLATLAGIGADVIGLNEIENTPGVDPIGDPSRGILAGLNGLLGAGTYDYIDTGVIGTDAIRVGLIYRPGSVTPVGNFETLTSTDDPRFIDTRSRPVLAQTFEENATGSRFTVAVNHLKSKGSGCGAGDDDLLNGQGNCNGTRTLAAQALVDWLASDPTGSGDADFLIVGDLNAYAMEAPIDAIKAGSDGLAGTADDYTNLVSQFLGTYAYSYVFDGMSGYLDHALSSATLTGQVTGVAEWHNNADEADLLDYDTSFKPPAQDALYEPLAYRSSDHDSIIVGLDLNAPPVITSMTGPAGSVGVGTTQTFDATFTDINDDDTHTTSWDWGDGSPDTNDSSTGSDSASHSYAAAGFYTVTFTVTDSTGLSDSATLLVIVTDPAGGRVNGSGTYAGGGSFMLSAKYSPSGSSINGSTTISAPGVSFVSTSIFWLVVSGNAGTYSGAGQLNGVSGYTFLVSVTDGGLPGSKDRVRFQIKDSGGAVVYDTQPGAPINALPTTIPTSGNVTVHH